MCRCCYVILDKEKVEVPVSTETGGTPTPYRRNSAGKDKKKRLCRLRICHIFEAFLLSWFLAVL